LFKKLDNIGAVGNPFGLHLLANRRIDGGEQIFPALPEFLADVNCSPTGGVIGTAQAEFDVDHPFPSIKEVVVAPVVVIGDVPVLRRSVPTAVF